MNKRIFLFIVSGTLFAGSLFSQLRTPAPPVHLLGEPVDISGDFQDLANIYFLADSLGSFDPATASGEIIYHRYEYAVRTGFNKNMSYLEPVEAREFPPEEYPAAPALPFHIDFVSARTFRIRAFSGPEFAPDEDSLMLVNGKVPQDPGSWKYHRTKEGYTYTGPYGSVTIVPSPWRIIIRDRQGRLLTQTISLQGNRTFTPLVPFCYVRRASDLSRSFDAVFSLSPGEKIFGCGESFTELNKRGQRVVLFTEDAAGVQNEGMYKPIPFFMSSRGYGIFMHTTTPVTCDFGKYYNGITSLMIGDDALDLFVFLGEPKDILYEYTGLTGKATMPPLWSFGFWMSRITYFSEKEGRAVADKLRVNRIPADVIHFDTGWFETDWQCDYTFSPSRFRDAQKMIADLKKQGFHVSLWQLPYFVPGNKLFPEIVSRGLAIKDRKGNLPTEDAILDFSNPATVAWYQKKIAGLLRMGVGAIKVDFGEAAPLNGLYHSGRTGFYEHNLYPLRYNKAVADITREVTGGQIIWARSAWAGSQRYPVHWGGDAENTDNAMAATLRGGLSLGLSGFAFWSHDLGGFVRPSPEALYRRWTPFGMLSSHVRSHGAPPTEPWEYSKSFLDDFRRADNMRYRLMPYIYAQAKACTENGLPMVRALFIEYPDDPGSWLIDDEYLFGADMLVAPLFEAGTTRRVYLPPGKWIDYQTDTVYTGGWHSIEAGEIPVVMLIKDGSVIPHVKLAQSTLQIDWSEITLKVYSSGNKPTRGLLYLPGGKEIHSLEVVRKNGKTELLKDPGKGRIRWHFDLHPEERVMNK